MRMLLAIMPTVLLVVLGQVVTKWRMQHLRTLLEPGADKLARAMSYITDPYIVGAYAAAFIGSVAWLFVVERYAISVAFPLYIGLTVVLVVVSGVVFFGESMTVSRALAIALILVGVAIASHD